MSQNMSNVATAWRRAESTAPTSSTAELLACGVASGLLFTIANLIEIPTRQGFDIRRHAISMLSLGDLGWLQILTFILTGGLAIAFAAGLRRTLRSGKAATWGPALIAIYGAGLVAAGVFTTDPGLGFPTGAPEGMPVMSWHGVLHSVAFFVLFSAITAACFVIARRLRSDGEYSWARYSTTTGVLAPLLVVAGMANPPTAGIPFLLAAVTTSLWVSVLAMHLYADPIGATDH